MKLVEREEGLPALVAEARGATRLAVDLEASGMFTYRARICTVQLAWDAASRIAVVDALSSPVAGLAALLDEAGPTKIVHDVAFDARLLADAGVHLGNVHDTAIAARMLGRTATGLASLLESELGLHITKTHQQDDWRVRPLAPEMLAYLSADVAHLEALEDVLWRQVRERGIEAEVLEETRYRLASAAAAAREPPHQPPYARVKGVDKLSERERAVLRAIAEVREREAERRDVPPHRVMPAEALVAIARARPRTAAEIGRMRGVSTASPAARAFVDELARQVASAPERLPDDERPWFDRPRPPPAETKARRERETRLLAWRRGAAKSRGVDEQVILPGHCAKAAVDDGVTTLEDIAQIEGIGGFRVSRDGEAILQALRGDGAPATPAEVHR
jgi:ribonuclease D